jgi:UDP-N-acetylmuramoyl-L-alanyl-D-glutamate--2,6-diaminopimelate ligase
MVFCKELKYIARRVQNASVHDAANTLINGITHDSRDVHKGELFVCLPGGSYDGHRFIPDAISRGASALVIQQDHVQFAPSSFPYILTPNCREALPEFSAAFYDDPSQKIKMLGVTGTNGKTTTAFMIHSILQSAGKTAGVIGTLGAYCGSEKLPSEHTTPEADQLQKLLYEMLQKGVQSVVMEVSSHAIAMKRTAACSFDGAVFTNLTQDHLDFHGDMESYFQTKLQLFTDYPSHSHKPFFASLNIDDPYGEKIAKSIHSPFITYAIHHSADIMASSIQVEPAKTSFHVQTPVGSADIRLNLGGSFQVSNALAAIGAGLGLGLDIETISRGLSDLKAVPGRFESIETSRDFSVIVDYAHTPDGLKNLLLSARNLNPARILLVFGCGGNRDRAKRPIMGKIGAEMADRVILTSDNPRHENPTDILLEIQQGLSPDASHVHVEKDRRTAIEMAIRQAKTGDLVILAGKGHEDYQILGDDVIPFDDREVARQILGEL